MRISRRLGLFATLTFAACVTDPNCTLAGCLEGTFVELEGAPAGPWTVEVRFGGTTLSKDCASGGNCSGTAFFEGHVPVTASVTVIRGSNSVTYNNLTPTTTISQPNGPRCEPRCTQARFKVQPPAAP